MPDRKPRAFPAFTPIAEHSLLVEFGDKIDPAITARVRALDTALTDAPFPGFRQSVPAYASLLICFDPLLADHAAAQDRAQALLDHKATTGRPPTCHDIAVCYDAAFAPDLAAVAQASGLTPEQVVATHLSGHYDVVMYGFAPGYAYLSGVPQPIRLPRKPAAQRGIPAGSLLIAGAQCLVSTITMPTGWWVIGRSPARILTGDPDRPFLFKVGDSLRFRRITRAEFEAGR